MFLYVNVQIDEKRAENILHIPKYSINSLDFGVSVINYNISWTLEMPFRSLPSNQR
jgi:hypothetical protein